MKKGNLFLVVIGLLISSTGLQAQNYTFRVLASKGANEIKVGGTWQPVKTGATLNLGDELKITENASVGLVHKSGKPVEEKKPGVYTVAELATRVQGESSVLNKYADFMLSSNSAEAKKNRLNATGAAHRGLGIKVFLPNNQFASVYNNTVFVSWDNTKEKGPFAVSFYNMFDDILMKVETKGSQVSIDLNDPKFVNESAILVEIQDKATGTKSDERYLIKRLSPAEREKINQGVAELSKEVAPDSEMGKLYFASFYEQNKLIIDAITTYEQVIKLAPDNPTYKEYYEEFLLRNKLKQNPK